MIPQIIHYCWFGKKDIPLLTGKCIESWQKYFPGWEIKLWNETNSPMQLAYMKNAFAESNFANLSNYTRLFALKEFGGIYFDTDIEVIRSFNFLEQYDCFVGFESGPLDVALSINNAVIGAVKGHEFINELLLEIENGFDGKEMAYLSSPGITTKLLMQNGLTAYGEQDIKHVHIFSMKAFYPYAWNDLFTFSCLSEETYTIHYWDMSWKDKQHELVELIQKNIELQNQIGNLVKQINRTGKGNVALKEWLRFNLKYVQSFFKKIE